MASMFSAAAALFARTNISQNYTILSPGVTVTVPGNMGLPSLPAGPPFRAGLWLIQPAQHKLNGKRVSVWTFEKRSPEMERLGGGGQAREMVLELLKAEVSMNIVRGVISVDDCRLCCSVGICAWTTAASFHLRWVRVVTFFNAR